MTPSERDRPDAARDAVTITVAHFASAMARGVTESDLADDIYAQLHCRLPVESWARDARGDARLDPRDFPRLLALANHGVGSWQAGWTVRAMRDGGGVVAESMGVRFWVDPGSFRAARTPVEPGDSVMVRIPREYGQLLPGFFMAIGDADDEDGAPCVRLYWNVSARGAIPLLKLVTTELNAAGIGFRFKVPRDPRDFGRADAAVLYLRRVDFDKTMPRVARITAEVRSYLSPETSFLAHSCEPGVCLAEDPSDGASFGQHRARLLAQAMLSPETSALPTVAARAHAVHAQLRAMGLDPFQLYRNAGSTATYRWVRVEPSDA
ncbi:MAG: T3SS effector HopA1 family protein [Gemmatimonadaceae bacterium]